MSVSSHSHSESPSIPSVSSHTGCSALSIVFPRSPIPPLPQQSQHTDIEPLQTNAFLTAAATVLKGQKRDFHKLVQEELNRSFGLKVTGREVQKKMDDMEKLSDGGWSFIMDQTDKAGVGDDWEKVARDGEDKDKDKEDYPVTLVRKEETK